jgi:hypothetical protein
VRLPWEITRLRTELPRVSDRLDQTKLPMSDPSFAGSVGRRIGDSAPDWRLIGDPGPPGGAPNILMVLIDDTGFGQPWTLTTTATSHRESPARSCAGKTARRPPATRTASAIGHRRSPIRFDPVPFRLITRLAAGATGRPAATLQPHARWRGQLWADSWFCQADAPAAAAAAVLRQ